ncbi:MAG TPA: hypothetical protein VHE30_18010 [Polyangiaceae bacterium]|nr:hypothetical protein [Polyangiaceae bacterium]
MSIVRFMLVVALGSLGAACGSSDSGGLSFSGPSQGGTASGGASSGNGDASAGGAPSGTSGANAGGATPDGSGGTPSPSGGANAGGAASGGGSAGSAAADAGVGGEAATGSGGAPVVFPHGGVISAQCADCATANCQAEARVCQADAECWAMGTCITTCVFPPQCALCLTASQQAASEFNSLECCTSQKCGVLCPSLNGGVIGCP